MFGNGEFVYHTGSDRHHDFIKAVVSVVPDQDGVRDGRVLVEIKEILGYYPQENTHGNHYIGEKIEITRLVVPKEFLP